MNDEKLVTETWTMSPSWVFWPLVLSSYIHWCSWIMFVICHNAQHYVQWKTNRAHQRYHHQLFCIAKYSGVKGESICSKAKAWLKLGDATSQWSHAQQNGLKRKGSRCCTWCFPRHRGLCKPFFSRDYIWDGTLSSFLFPIFEKHESLSSKSLLMQWFTDKIQTSGCILWVGV